MRHRRLVLAFLCFVASAQVASTASGAAIEHFTLRGGRSYDGIWDPSKSEIHVVINSNHVSNVAIAPGEIVSRKFVADGSKVKLQPEVQMDEQALTRSQQDYKSAQSQLAAANQQRDALRATWVGKNLNRATYNSVMAQYRAANERVAAAQKAVMEARNAFNKAHEAYLRAGGKKQFTLP